MMSGAEIKELREKLGMTAKEFGVAVGFSERSAQIRIYEYEGEKTPVSRPVELLCKYIKKYGVLRG
jgi:DNA-binding transcriptional regulator YiaG